MTDTTTDVTAVLAEIRMQAEDHHLVPGTDALRLVAALEAVLKQHQRGRVVIVGALCPRHESHRHFSITGSEAADVAACPECAAMVYNSCTGCGPQVPLDSCPAVRAISAALLGEEGPGSDG